MSAKSQNATIREGYRLPAEGFPWAFINVSARSVLAIRPRDISDI